jgi:hypothetical protein
MKKFAAIIIGAVSGRADPGWLAGNLNCSFHRSFPQPEQRKRARRRFWGEKELLSIFGVL